MSANGICVPEWFAPKRLRKASSIEHEIVADGRTVWINGTEGAIARFGVSGIDIHNTHKETTECLFCTHSRTTRADWKTFRAKVFEHFRINVPHKFMPTRLRRRGANA